MKLVFSLFLAFNILFLSSSFADMTKLQCEAKYKKYEHETKNTEIIVSVLATIVHGALEIRSVNKKIKEAEVVFNNASTILKSTKATLDATILATSEVAAEAAVDPEVGAAVEVVDVAEEAARLVISEAETVLKEIKTPLKIITKGVGVFALSFVAEEFAFAKIFGKIEEQIKNAEKLCIKKTSEKKFQCVDNYLAESTSAISSANNSTMKFKSKFDSIATPLQSSQKELNDKLSKITKSIESLEKKIEHFAHVTKLFKAFKAKLHSKVYLTLKWPSVTHPTRLAHKKISFSVDGLLKDFKKEFYSVEKFLGKEAKFAFHELIKVTGLKSLEKDLVGKAKKAVHATKKEVVKIAKKDFPPLANFIAKGKDALEHITVINKLLKETKGFSSKSLNMPDTKLFANGAMTRKCGI